MYASGVFYINSLFSVRFKIFIHVVYMTFKRKFFQKVDYPGGLNRGWGWRGVLSSSTCDVYIVVSKWTYFNFYTCTQMHIQRLSSFFLWSFKQRDSFHIQILMIFFFGKVHIVSDFEIIEFDYPRYGSLMDCYYKIYACLNNRTGN